MAKLTSEQLAFLNRHGVSISEVYDATGMRRKHYYSDMKLLEMRVAIGVTDIGGSMQLIGRNRTNPEQFLLYLPLDRLFSFSGIAPTRSGTCRVSLAWGACCGARDMVSNRNIKISANILASSGAEH